MTSLSDFHVAFAAAVSSGKTAALAPFLIDQDQGARVYRNNVLSAVAGALASSFRAVRRLVGEDFFNAAAAAYFAAAPPRLRTLVAYGETFPRFLETMPASAMATPYLGDVARLDRAWLEAHIAAEAPALAPGDLAHLDADALAGVRVKLHASARLVHCGWRIHDIWVANRADGPAAQAQHTLTRGAQAVLVWRHGGEVQHRVLSVGEAGFLSALDQGAALAAAAAAASAAEPDADVSALFAGALAGGVLGRWQGEDRV